MSIEIPSTDGGYFKRYHNQVNVLGHLDLVDRLRIVSRLLMDLGDEKTMKRFRQLSRALDRLEKRSEKIRKVHVFYPTFLIWAKEGPMHVAIGVARNLESAISEIFPFVRKKNAVKVA